MHSVHAVLHFVWENAASSKNRVSFQRQKSQHLAKVIVESLVQINNSINTLQMYYSHFVLWGRENSNFKPKLT